MEKLANWKEADRGVFLVNLLAILYDPKTKKILIGRREKDPYVEKLSWVFPGGRPGYAEDLEHYLKKEVKVKTNMEIKDEKVIYAKTYPEKREFLSIYYACVTNGNQAIPGESLVELKWVKPTEVTKYFTTSLHPKVLDFLKKLEQGED